MFAPQIVLNSISPLSHYKQQGGAKRSVSRMSIGCQISFSAFNTNLLLALLRSPPNVVCEIENNATAWLGASGADLSENRGTKWGTKGVGSRWETEGAVLF